MHKLPVITVVTPNYNGAQFLERTIQSVLGQDYPALEYIIVDGDSSDASESIIQRYSDKLKWSCSQPDGGQADAISKGFSRATGEVLCWLNSDDLFLPGALQAVGQFFDEHPNAEVATGGAYCIDEKDRPLRTLLQCTCTRGIRASARRLRFYGQDGVYQQATFWRRTAYLAAGGLRDLKFAMDLDLFVRLASRQRFHVIPQYLACFRSHAAAKSHMMEHVRRSDVVAIKRDYGVLEADAITRSVIYGWFRAESLCRKALLHSRMLLGFEQLPAVAGNARVPDRCHEQN